MVKVFKVILWLSSVGFIFSALSELQKLSGAIILHKFCTVTTGTGCRTVQDGAYGSLYGVPNPYFGMLGFAVLMALAYLQLKKVNHDRSLFIAAGSFVSMIVAFWFIYLQYFVIQAWCIYCIIVDVTSIVLFVVSLKLYDKDLWNALKSYF
jgi:uncharacterized membrane protein